VIEVTQMEPSAKKPRLSFEADFNIASTSFSHNEILEISNTDINISKTENIIDNITISNIILKTFDVINFDLKNLLNNHIVGRAILDSTNIFYKDSINIF